MLLNFEGSGKVDFDNFASVVFAFMAFGQPYPIISEFPPLLLFVDLLLVPHIGQIYKQKTNKGFKKRVPGNAVLKINLLKQRERWRNEWSMSGRTIREYSPYHFKRNWYINQNASFWLHNQRSFAHVPEHMKLKWLEHPLSLCTECKLKISSQLVWHEIGKYK